MLYAVIQCNRDDCPLKDCEYNFSELPENLLPNIVGGGKVIIANNDLYCKLGQSVGTVYLFKNHPDNVPNCYIYNEK
jgi:hypothetical protein